jgi:hypothetical protein
MEEEDDLIDIELDLREIRMITEEFRKYNALQSKLELSRPRSKWLGL